MKIQNKHIIIIVLLALSIVLAYDSVSNYINPYIPVSDITANQGKYTGKSLQIIGEMESGSLIRTDDGSISFTLIDDLGSIRVTYRGIPPSNLEEEGNQVVVLGTLQENGEIDSSQLLVKCPSKYEGEEQQGQSHILLTVIGIVFIGIGYIVVTMFMRKN